MENKLYTLFMSIIFSVALPARVQAQDTTSCNPRFYTSADQNQAFFNAVDSQAHIIHYWNFGDGSNVGFSHGHSIIFHTYSQAGVYKVTHIIKDSLGGGCYDSSSQTVAVTLPPACTIYFDANRDTVNHHLYNLTSHPGSPAGAIDTIRWFANDSLIGTGASLSNLYFPSGIFTICVRMSTNGGCRAEQCQQIRVSDSDSIPVDSIPNPPPPPCRVGFTYTVNPQVTNELTFKLQDTVRYDSVVWTVISLPDSVYKQFFYGRQFTHLFTDSGCYAIFVMAHGSNCPGSAYQQICIDSIHSGGGAFISSYPNPAASQVNMDLKLSKDNSIYIHIFNSMGNEMLTRQVAGTIGINHITIPTSNLPTGIYYVQIQYGNEVRRSKIQKL